ncbi:MAG: Lsr2 family DNA-binding protein [Streptomyces sp.]|uniref:Lsr2 family DNA-binding protein n=1 Tax=Streptomyces sp. TaxID=1931 RepID=UPI003D6A6F20
MTELDRLAELCPPPTRRIPEQPQPDWDTVERILGTRLPEDYKQLVEAYGPGQFNSFLSIYQPRSYAPTDFLDIEGETPSIRAALERSRDWTGEPMPYPVEALQPAGGTGNGDYLFWVTNQATDPESWAVAIKEPNGTRWFTFTGTITAFLTRFVAGDISVPMFPDGLLEEPPSFRPFEPSTGQASHLTRQEIDAHSNTIDSQAIREWAWQHGYDDLPPRGRIPVEIRRAFDEAHETGRRPASHGACRPVR